MNAVKTDRDPARVPHLVKPAKAAARLAISDHGTRLTLVFSLMICGAAVICLFMAAAAFTYAFSVMTDDALPQAAYSTADIVSLLPILLVSAPLCLGFYRMAVRASHGESIGLPETFRYFSSFPLVAKSWLVGIIATFPVIFGVAAYSLADLLPEGDASELVRFMFIPIVLIFLCVINLLSLPTAYSFICSDDSNPLKCFAVSVKASSKRKLSVLGLRFGFLPLMLLSLCTVGVLFLIYTIPYMTTAEIYLSEMILSDRSQINATEDKTHE